MNSNIEALEYFLRCGLALLLVPSGLLFALMLIGVGNATTNASPAWLFGEALLYLAVTSGCIIVALRTKRIWLSWVAVIIGWAPLALLFGPIIV